MIQINIPVSKHVRKYLIRKYGTEHTLTKTSLLGQMLFLALETEAKKPQPLPDENKYAINVGEFYFRTKGHSVTAEMLEFLGESMEQLFREEMWTYLDLKVQQGGEALVELRSFVELYDITDDDIKLESLYKSYQRYCKGPIANRKRKV